MKNIMNNKGLFLLLMWFSACTGKLDITPTDVIDRSVAYKNVEDLESGLAAIYGLFPKSPTLRTSTYQTNLCKMASKGRNIGSSGYTWQYTPDTPSLMSDYGWSGYYSAINAVNILLAEADLIPAPDDESVKQVNQIKGEAYGLRAYAHFELFRIFAESYTQQEALAVPYMTTSEVGMPSRNTVGEVYAALQQDLEESKKWQADGLSREDLDYIYFNTLAVTAMEARIALYQQDYKTAITKATEALSAKNIVTSSSYQAMFDFDSPNNEEVYFKFNIPAETSRLGNLWRDNSGLVNFFPTQDFINAFAKNDDGDPEKDIRYGVQVANDPNQIEQSAIVGKYIGGNSAINAGDFIVFRASEMLLTRAEAYFRDGQAAKALEDLDALRKERIEGFTDGGENGNSIFTAIKHQRLLELSFEGHLWFDLRRWGDPIVRVDTTTPTTPKVLVANDFRFVMPIPQHEILANDNMSQNDGY
ncbi:RagB/SusD family nutrient uptake outer membrane protein [Persicobacter psychrovividus]|uniref:Membrane protein n=1 Tax=Persicobacter psychrovividus TaxID=387638 RepID=A0ABM7VC49_9BACT|nr:membrane protein [Persicobacter psychrovividus]